MPTRNNEFVRECLQLLLRPVMKFCLRRSLKIQEILESAKVELIEAAAREVERLGEKVSVSRLSIMTGIHRGDVERIFKNVGEEKASENTVSRIIGTWQEDKRFVFKNGKPRILQFDGKTGEFGNLIRAVSGELSPYTVLFELERLGVVQRTPKGIELVMSEYIIAADAEKSFRLLSQNSSDLLSSVEENVARRRGIPNLHLSTDYDNISSQNKENIQRWINEEGTAFHSRVRKFLSKHDRDITPNAKDESPPLRISVCTFSHSESFETALPSNRKKRRGQNE